jgi:hypothetical protein
MINKGGFKMHLTEGEIRAYQDHSLPQLEQDKAGSHLASCALCRSKAAQLEARSQRVQANLSQLNNDLTSSNPADLPSARTRLADRLRHEKEIQPMKPTVFSRIPRYAWAALVLVAVLALALAFEPVRALANGFLALFRVEQIRVVQFDPTNLPNQLENSSQLEYIMSNDVNIERSGDTQKAATPEEAAAIAGFPLHLPVDVQGDQRFVVEPAAKMSFTVNLEMVRGVLKDIGRQDIQLPDNLDGAVVQMSIPTSVTAFYGDCKAYDVPENPDPDATPIPMKGYKNCTTLMQVASPEISAPPDLDLTQIGEAYLQVLGMDAEQAASFAGTVNWTTTFIVPIPKYSVDYSTVDINGSAGTLIKDKYDDYGHYALIWIKDGTVFGLSGWGDQAAALQVASTIQ